MSPTGLHASPTHAPGIAGTDFGPESLVDRLLAASDDVVGLRRPDGSFAYLSPAFTRHTGIRTHELFEGPAPEVVHPDDRDTYARSLAASREHGVSAGLIRLMHLDKQWHWWELHFTDALNDAVLHGTIIRATLVDEREEAERHRRATHRVERAVFDMSRLSLSVGPTEVLGLLDVWLADLGSALGAKAVFLDVIDESARQFVSLSQWRDPGLGDTPLSLAGPSIATLEIPLRMQFISAGEPAVFEFGNVLVERHPAAGEGSSEYLLPLVADGHVHGALSIHTFTPAMLDDERRELVRIASNVIASAIDRYHSEVELRSTERRFRALIHRSNEAIVVFDRDLQLVYASPAFARMRGRDDESVGDLSRTSWAQYVHEDDVEVIRAALTAVINEPNRTQDIMMRLSHGDGAWIHVEGTVSNRLDDPIITGIVANLRDVTVRRHTEDVLQTTRRLEERLVAISTRFLDESSELVDRSVRVSLGEIATEIDARRGLVYTRSDAGTSFTLLAHWDKAGRDLGHASLRELDAESLQGLWSRFEFDEFVSVGSPGEFRDGWPDGAAFLERAGYGSLGILPLRRHGSFEGIVMFEREADAPFSSSLAGTLQLFSQLTMAALARRSHLDITQRRREIEELGARLAERFLDVPARRVDENINRALRELASFAKADGAFLTTLDEVDGTEATTHAWPQADEGGMWSALGVRRPVDAAAFALAQLRQPVIVTDRLDFEERPAVVGSEATVHSMVTVPIHRGGTFVGQIGLLRVHPGSNWSTDLVDLMRRCGQIFQGAMERRDADTLVRASEARFRALVENASDMVMVLDADLNPTFISPAVERLTGWTAEELTREFRRDVLHPDDLMNLRDGALSAMTTGRSRIEFRHLTRDGRWLHIESTVTNALSNPAIAGLILNSRDISERKEAEAALERRRIVERTVLGISRLFLDTPVESLDEAVDESLRRIGSLLEAGHCYIVEVDERSSTLSRTHEWFSPDHDSDSQIYQGVPTDSFGWTLSRFRAGEPAVVTDVATMDANRERERSLLEASGVTSVAEVPLIVGGNLIGLVGVDTDRRGRTWIEDEVTLVRNLAELVATSIDRRRVFAALLASESRFRALVHFGSEMVLVVEESGRASFASPAITTVLGWEPSEILRRNLFEELIVYDDAVGLRETVERSINEPTAPVEVEMRMRRADGRSIWVGATVTNMLHTPGVEGLVIEARDISERKALEADLERQARTDQLTGLPNRTSMLDELTDSLSEPSRAQNVAVMFLDLDGFKAVNDTFGHEAGDSVLIEIGRRLRNIMRPGDVVARFAGDEFVLICHNADTELVCTKITDRVFGTIAKPIPLPGGGTATIGTSLGVAMARHLGHDAAELLRRSDAAMYEAKRAGKGRAFFAHDLPDVTGDPWQPSRRPSAPDSTA